MLAQAKTALVTHHHRRSSHRYSTRSSHRLSSHRSCHQLIHKSSHRLLIGHLIRRLLLSHTPVTLPSPAAVTAIPHHISTSAFSRIPCSSLRSSSLCPRISAPSLVSSSFVPHLSIHSLSVLMSSLSPSFVSRASVHTIRAHSFCCLFLVPFLNKIPPKRFTRFCSSYSLSLKSEHLRKHK